MTQEEYKNFVSPSVVRTIFDTSTINAISGKYIILVSGRVVCIGGKMFFDSRAQATKAFYNSFSWRAKRELSIATNSNTHYWNSPEGTKMWLGFKEAITNNYGFKIVRL